MSQDSITLGQNPPIELDDGYSACGVHLRDASLLVLGVFFERVSCIIVGHAGVLPEQTDDLAAATGLEVEVVDTVESEIGWLGGEWVVSIDVLWYPANGFVRCRFCEASFCGRHLCSRDGVVDS